ncbi:MAG: FKBP-type peptidyl-prolyl cis-trans isomerase [Sulfurovum sp.]
MTIQKNALVSLELVLQDEQGRVIEENNEEIIYLHGGYGHLFAKLEEALEGKRVGDTFSVSLSPSEAFGEFNEALVFRELLSDLPSDISVGMELDSDEDDIIYHVLEIDETHALIDGNHTYAGVPLVAEGVVLEIEYASDEVIEEILHGYHHH